MYFGYLNQLKLNLMKIYYFILTLFFCSISFAQNTISGSVKDAKNEPIPGVNVKVSGESLGAITDATGKFVLKTPAKVPFTIEISSIGFAAQKIQITSLSKKVEVVLLMEDTKLDDIVVSASRTPERIKESPVTIERMTIRDIKKSASPTFYDGLENLKEVQMNTSSMSFKSINTRGFATVANTRFMQLVDGMDNSSPLLNFVIGNMIGISEIDVQSVELLPGASSALYGANAFNGILFMNSKSPFTSQGVTAYVKYGQTSQQAAGTNDYTDYGVRIAHAFDKHFAAKANFSFLNGEYEEILFSENGNFIFCKSEKLESQIVDKDEGVTLLPKKDLYAAIWEVIGGYLFNYSYITSVYREVAEYIEGHGLGCEILDNEEGDVKVKIKIKYKLKNNLRKNNFLFFIFLVLLLFLFLLVFIFIF